MTFEGLSSDSGELPAGSAGYAVKLPVFEGPLDLLLHLIRQNEMDITDVPIAQISAQYLDYLGLMQDLNLDIAGEYLVMAATLALIKSRTLLPSEDGEEEDDAGDPRAELIARLLEYARYKEVAEELSKMRLLGRDVFAAVSAGPERIPEGEREIEVGLFELIDAFRLVLEHAPTSEIHIVEAEEVSVRDRMIFVMELLAQGASVEFNQIFENPSGALPGRPLIVATFLAILELTRLAALTIYQGVDDLGAPAGPIRLRMVAPEVNSKPGELDWSERISELM